MLRMHLAGRQMHAKNMQIMSHVSLINTLNTLARVLVD